MHIASEKKQTTLSCLSAMLSYKKRRGLGHVHLAHYSQNGEESVFNLGHVYSDIEVDIKSIPEDTRSKFMQGVLLQQDVERLVIVNILPEFMDDLMAFIRESCTLQYIILVADASAKRDNNGTPFLNKYWDEFNRLYTSRPALKDVKLYVTDEQIAEYTSENQ